MTRTQKRFTRFYWITVLLGLCIYSLISSFQYKRQCHQVEGRVVSQVNLPSYKMVGGRIRSYDHFRPQVAYMVDDVKHLLTLTNRTLETGDIVQVLYKKGSPAEALVYTWAFWFDYAVLIPAFVIAAFLFCVVLITITNYGNQRVVVPGELDEFISDKVSGSYSA